MYFVTVCAKNRQRIFGKLNIDGDVANVILSDIGECVEKTICEIPEHYSGVVIDRYCIMPDHVHLIICLYADTGGRMQTVCPGISAPTENMPSVSQIVGSMKRRVSRLTGIALWQKSYYEHVIRNYADYIETVKYIENNPIQEYLNRTNP